MAYIGSSPTKVVSRQSANIFTYTATANQTAFTGSDANGNTLACTPSDIMVHMNGIKLEESDYTASTTTVTLGSGAAAGDEITITAFVTFESADHYNKSTADTRYVNTTGDTMTGTLVAGTRLQVGDSSITQQYPALGYVADFQASSGSQTFISIAEPSASSLGNNGVIIGEDASDTYITQRGNKNIKLATQDLNRLIVDGSGRVTMPYQPSMSGRAIRPIDTSGYVNLNVNLYLNDLQHNIGNHWNNSTGVWTCPVAGRYWVFVSILMDDNTTSGELARYEIKKNGSEFFRGYDQSYNSGSTYGGMIASGGIFNCSANDTITIVGTNGKLHAGAESNFTICLLG